MPKAHLEDDVALGSWVNSLRQVQSNLSSDKIEKLITVDFVWNTNEESWSVGYEKLKVFFTREGHSLVSQRYCEDGYGLGSWVNSQRNHKQKLSPEQVHALEKLKFVWDVRSTAWSKGFSSLSLFYHREGHSNPRADHNEGTFRLGRWVSKQRSRRSALSPDQCEQLQQLEFVWDAREAAWQIGFNHLRTFHTENGHSDVPVLYEATSIQLGTWVRNRRKEVDTMSHERKQRLDEIGFIWDTTKDKT